jgi:hypothetical protein
MFPFPPLKIEGAKLPRFQIGLGSIFLSQQTIATTGIYLPDTGSGSRKREAKFRTPK